MCINTLFEETEDLLTELIEGDEKVDEDIIIPTAVGLTKLPENIINKPPTAELRENQKDTDSLPEYNILDEILKDLGLIKRSLPFYESPDLVAISVIISTMWIAFPFFMLFFLAGLKSIPKEIIEGAMIDGANAFQQFIYITLPSLKGVIVISTTLSIVWGFNFYDFIYVVSKGGPLSRSETFVILAQRMAFDQGDFGYTSALGVVWLLMLVVASFIYLKQMKVL